MAGLHDLIVKPHKLTVEYEVTFLVRDHLPVAEAVKNMIAQEIDEHLAAAMEKRSFGVLQIEKADVVIDA